MQIISYVLSCEIYKRPVFEMVKATPFEEICKLLSLYPMTDCLWNGPSYKSSELHFARFDTTDIKVYLCDARART